MKKALLISTLASCSAISFSALPPPGIYFQCTVSGEVTKKLVK